MKKLTILLHLMIGLTDLRKDIISRDYVTPGEGNSAPLEKLAEFRRQPQDVIS